MKHAPAAAAAGVALVLLLGGCTAPADTPTDGGDADTSGLAHAQEQLDTYSEVVEGFLPSEPLTDGASLEGKTIFYIPAVAQIPFFATAYTALVDAFSNTGVNVQICDAQANPATMAACLDQALNTGAAGVIIDAVPPQIAQESYDAVVNAGIPVVLGNIPVPEGSPDTVKRVGPDTAAATALAADALIVASEGAAQVLAVRVIDSPTTQGWFDEGAGAEFAEFCPDCTVTIVDTKTADLQNAPAKVSAGLLADPSIEYLLPQLSPEILPTIAGATDAGRPELEAASTATTLGDLQLVSEGPNLIASVGWDIVRTSWVAADLLSRLMVGQAVTEDYTVPLRVFTTENVADLDLSDEGWATSAWFGGTDYQDTLIGLWK